MVAATKNQYKQRKAAEEIAARMETVEGEIAELKGMVEQLLKMQIASQKIDPPPTRKSKSKKPEADDGQNDA